MKSMDKGIPTPAVPAKKGGDVNKVNLMGGLSSGAARSKRAGMSIPVPKK